MLHIGKKIEEQINKKGITVVEFANMINKSRTNVYDIFERETIDTGLLLKISQVLDYNFFNLYLDVFTPPHEQKVISYLETIIEMLKNKE